MRRADRLLELVERFDADRLGELVVDDEVARRLHRLDRHIEARGLAGQVLGEVVARERDVDGLLLAGLDADQLVLEARNERVRAEIDRDVGAGAAFEGLAVDLAGEVDDDAVVLGGLGALLLVGIGDVAPGEVVEARLSTSASSTSATGFSIAMPETSPISKVGRTSTETVQAKSAAPSSTDLTPSSPPSKSSFGSMASLMLVVVDDLLVGLADHGVDDVGHHRAAIEALEMGDRHLARAEPVDADLVLHLLELRVGARWRDPPPAPPP